MFCQCAIETAQRDKDIVVQLQLEKKKNYVDTLKKLILSWDSDGDGVCSLTEFKEHLEDEETAALLASLDIESRDALAMLDVMETELMEHIWKIKDFPNRRLFTSQLFVTRELWKSD